MLRDPILPSLPRAPTARWSSSSRSVSCFALAFDICDDFADYSFVMRLIFEGFVIRAMRKEYFQSILEPSKSTIRSMSLVRPFVALPTHSTCFVVDLYGLSDFCVFIGPIGKFPYNSVKNQKHLTMIAGGTGITPLFPVSSSPLPDSRRFLVLMVFALGNS